MDKKTYEKPSVLHTQAITARAVNCNKSDDSCTMNGAPLQS